MEAEAKARCVVARTLRERVRERLAPGSVERLDQQAQELPPGEQVDGHGAVTIRRPVALLVVLDLESVQLGGGGRDFEGRHVEAVPLLQVAQTRTFEPESLREVPHRPAFSQVDQKDSFVADDLYLVAGHHGGGIGADTDPARDAELAHGDQDLGEPPRAEGVLVDEPPLRRKPEAPKELPGRHPAAGERLQRVEPGGQPDRARDTADDSPACCVHLGDGASERSRGTVRPDEHPRKTLGRSTDEEDSRRLAHTVDQGRIRNRAPVVDSELGELDGKGQEFGERPVASQGAQREPAVELGPVVRGCDDDQIRRAPRNPIPDFALVEPEDIAHQDEGPRSSLGEARPRPSRQQACGNREEHRPPRPTRAPRIPRAVPAGAACGVQPPRPVMRAYSRGNTAGRAPGRENTV